MIGVHVYNKGTDDIMRMVRYLIALKHVMKRDVEDTLNLKVDITRRKVMGAQLMWPSNKRDWYRRLELP